MKRTLSAAAALLLAAMLVAIPAAEAKPKPQKKTQLTLEVSFIPQSAQGKVKSVKACKANRQILLYEVVEGSAEKVAQTRSGENGRYAFEGVMINPNNQYEALTFPVTKRRVVCKGDNSPRVTPSGPSPQ